MSAARPSSSRLGWWWGLAAVALLLGAVLVSLMIGAFALPVSGIVGSTLDRLPLVEVDHGRGYVTRYAHNKENVVKRGDRVEKGQKIATMGSSGRVTGTHLHFEVMKDDKPLNPMTFIRKEQVRNAPAEGTDSKS